MFQRELKMVLKIGNVFINEDDPFPVIVKATTEIDTYIKGHHVYKNIWTFLLWAPFFSRKEPKIVCLNSRRPAYVFKNRMGDSKTFECSNSCQKVGVLLKKLGEIRESSSYREKFIQGTDKFVRHTEMIEFSSTRVKEIFFT